MNSGRTKVSSKEKQKNKPKIGVGSKDEKRKAKKEKLAQALQMKKEAQEEAKKPPPEPVTLGKEFFDILDQISATDVSGRATNKPGKKIQAQNAMAQMKQIFANSNFSNPQCVFSAVGNQLNGKVEARQMQEQMEQQKKIEQQKKEKLLAKQENSK